MATNSLPAAGTRFHIALGVPDVARSVSEYSVRLGLAPTVHVANEYALWRTDQVNFSIRRVDGPAALRHLGLEDPTAASFSEETDVNGIVWERFTAEEQLVEIWRYWPTATPDASES
jgi:catechol 2,3-dioxygenase-like lactoylglutathione lyase family enzyme